MTMIHHPTQRRNSGMEFGLTLVRSVFPPAKPRNRFEIPVPENLRKDVGLPHVEERRRWENYL